MFRPRSSLIYGVICVLSCAVLMVEAIVSKMFKIDYVNSFQFVVITEAIFGLGIGSALVLGLPKVFSRDRLPTVNFVATITLASLVTCLLWSFHGAGFGFLADNLLTLAIFVLFGVALTMLFRFAELDMHKLYFWNLLGSGAGAGLVPVGFNTFGLEGTTLLVASAIGVLAVCFGGLMGRGQALVAGILSAAILGGWPWLSRPASPGSLSRQEFEAKVSLTRWNHFSRIDVQRSEAPVEWGLSQTYEGPRTMGRYFTFDCIAIREDNLRYSSIITGLNERESLNWDITHLPHYGLAPGARVLVIGSGGGKDVLAARASPRVDEVVAVEINPLIIDVMREEFPESFEATYGGAGVVLHIDEIRSFLARDKSRYHLLEIGTLKNQSLLSAAATQIEENYIYTIEAFEAYRDHLHEDGILSITWYASNQRFFARLLATARHVFGDLTERVLYVQSRTQRPMATLMIAKNPLSDSQRTSISDQAKQCQFQFLYPSASSNLATRVIEEQPLPPEYDLSPVRDDRPFFYRFQRGLGGVLRVVAAMGLAAAAALLLLRLTCRRWSGQGPLRLGPALYYFLGLGAGYISVQLFLLQKLTFFIGQPVYSLATVLAGLLVANGLGSLSFPSTRLSLRTVLLAMTASCIVYGLVLPLLLDRLVWAPLGLRISISVAVLLPIGWLMGIGFPSGLAQLEGHRSTIPFGFVVNAWGTVLGMSLAVCLATYAGYTSLAGLGALFYAICLMSRPGTKWLRSHDFA